MTDEEMAEQYVKENGKVYYHPNGKPVFTREEDLKFAFIAGLEAGRKQKWHKVADGDLPPVRMVIFVSGYLGDIKDLHGFDEWDGEKWLNDDMPGLVREAWCEIPQYTEE